MKSQRILQILSIITLVIVLIQSCTSSLFVIKGQSNKIKTEQNVKADSTSVSINNQK